MSVQNYFKSLGNSLSGKENTSSTRNKESGGGLLSARLSMRSIHRSSISSSSIGSNHDKTAASSSNDDKGKFIPDITKGVTMIGSKLKTASNIVAEDFFGSKGNSNSSSQTNDQVDIFSSSVSDVIKDLSKNAVKMVKSTSNQLNIRSSTTAHISTSSTLPSTKALDNVPPRKSPRPNNPISSIKSNSAKLPSPPPAVQGLYTSHSAKSHNESNQQQSQPSFSSNNNNTMRRGSVSDFLEIDKDDHNLATYHIDNSTCILEEDELNTSVGSIFIDRQNYCRSESFKRSPKKLHTDPNEFMESITDMPEELFSVGMQNDIPVVDLKHSPIDDVLMSYDEEDCV